MSGWHLITGEYPPDRGGIADHSALLAEALARLGHEVHVWTTGEGGESDDEPGPMIHRSGAGWGRRDLARLGEGLDAFLGPRRLLVQYAPNAWGFKGANLGFARWLAGRKRRGDRIDTLFHEVWYIPGPGDTRPIRRLLPLIQRPMARKVLAASDRVFVATPAWAGLLGPIDPAVGRPLTWLPAPSLIPVVEDRPGVEEIRARLGPGAIVGSFGTFSNAAGELLSRVLPGILLDNPGALGLLIGRNGEGFAARLVAGTAGLAGRVVATGGLPPAEVSRHLRACDLLVQVYPDGVCGRRSTVMAGLAHGVPVLSNEGSFTSPVWRESGGIALAPDGDVEASVRLASELLSDTLRRERLGALGRELHERRFAIDRTIETLLGGA